MPNPTHEDVDATLDEAKLAILDLVELQAAHAEERKQGMRWDAIDFWQALGESEVAFWLQHDDDE